MRRRPSSAPTILTAALTAFAAVYVLLPAQPTAQADPGQPPRELSVYYARCDEARAAGAAPIYSGQPGYRSELDADGDGIACEPYRGGF